MRADRRMPPSNAMRLPSPAVRAFPPDSPVSAPAEAAHSEINPRRARNLAFLAVGAWSLLTSLALFAPAELYGKPSPAVHVLSRWVHGLSRWSGCSDSFFLHVVLLAGETLVLWFALRTRCRSCPAKAMPTAAALALGFSLLTELIQSLWIAGRAFEWRDMCANTLGIVVATVAIGGVRGTHRLCFAGGARLRRKHG